MGTRGQHDYAFLPFINSSQHHPPIFRRMREETVFVWIRAVDTSNPTNHSRQIRTLIDNGEMKVGELQK